MIRFFFDSFVFSRIHCFTTLSVETYQGSIMPTLSIEQAIFRETQEVFHLTSFNEGQTAVVSLTNQAQHEINLYSHILCPHIFNTEPVIKALTQFCLKNNRTQINILINDSRPITQLSHRLLSLSHRLSSSIHFKKLNPRLAIRDDDFICFDKSAYLQLTHYQHYAGTCHFSDSDRTVQLLSYFKEAWEQSYSDPELRSITL